MSNRYLDIARQATGGEPRTGNAPPSLPGRAERPCLACGRQCPEGVLFDTGACFEGWRVSRAARRAERRATSPPAARTATSPAHSIPPETRPDGGAA